MLEENTVILGTTCFKEHQEHKVECRKENCKYWINSSKHLNCTMIMSDEGPKTLQEIGEVFGVTRMRICQIEKTVLTKLKTKKSLCENEK